MRSRPVAIVAALTVGLCVVGSCSEAVGAADTPPHPVNLPPGLKALLMKETQLPDSQVVVTLRAEVRRRGRWLSEGREKIAAATAPARLSAISMTAKDARVVEVGGYVYGAVRGLAAADGGSKWVRTTPSGGADVTRILRAFVSLAGGFESIGTKVLPLGDSTVDGQAVTGYLIEHPLLVLGATATSRLYFAADGLLVREIATTKTSILRTDFSITTPVVVVAPPADKTIDESRLTPVQLRRVRRLLPGLRGG